MPSHHLIESLTITSGIHFPSLHLDFRDGLNCLLGGRGTGKSGVLHLIRFALGARIPEAYADEHDEYIRATLGTGTATVRARSQHGVRYTTTRTYGSPPVVHGEDGVVLNVSLDGDLFKIDAYAQNEIEGIARDPKAQLDLIDKFAEADVRRIDEAVQQIDRKLAQVAGVLRRLGDEIADDAGREAELPTVAEALKGLDLGGSDPDVPERDRARAQEAHAAKVQRGREHAAIGALSSELASVRSALDAFTHDALRKLGRAVEGDLERGAHGDLFRHVHAAMQRMAGAIEGASGRLRTELGSVEETVTADGRALAAAHAKEDEAYQALVVRRDADRERAAQCEQLHRKFEELSAVARRLADRRREEGAKRHEWETLLAERTRLLAEKSAHRKRVGDELTRDLDGEVRVSVSPGLDSSPYAALLADILQGANIRPASLIPTIAERIPPSVLVSIVERKDLEPLMEIDPAKTGKEERAAKIVTLLRASGRLHEIATAKLEDVPLIELKVASGYRPSNRVSTGQRCACILPILLLLSGAPLLIDQVEDNLDNAFIYDVLVKRLAHIKTRRQLIVVTHNPNPPTLAGAARILVLGTTEEGHCTLVVAGTFEEVLPHVERTEGGREAFLKRGEKYGHFRSEDQKA